MTITISDLIARYRTVDAEAEAARLPSLAADEAERRRLRDEDDRRGLELERIHDTIAITPARGPSAR